MVQPPSGLAVGYNPSEFDSIPDVIYEYLGELSSIPVVVNKVDINFSKILSFQIGMKHYNGPIHKPEFQKEPSPEGLNFS